MVFGLWVLAQAVGAHADLNVQIEPESVAVAEPVVLTLTSDGGAVVWPDWAEALPGWQVVPVSVTETEARLSLRSWLPGEIAIPALTAGTPGGVTFATEPQTVTVNSVLPDDADVADAATLRDSAGAVPAAEADGGQAVWWIVAALTAGIVLFGVWLMRRRGERTRLETLTASRLDTAAQSRDVGEAIDAVRSYVETRFGYQLRHKTASELASDPDAGSALGAGLHDSLSELQQRGEALRFAGGPDDEAPEIIALARQVFDQAQVAAKEVAA